MLVDGGSNGVRRPRPSISLPFGITVVGLGIVLYFTLFPFDLVNGNASLGEVLRRFSLTTGSVWTWRAMPANVVMLVPLGLGVAGMASARGWSRRTVVGATTVVGLVLSAVLEVAQAAWLLRLPSFDDIVANAAGAALGAWLWIRFGSSLTSLAHRAGVAARSGRGRVLVLALALLPIALVLVVTTLVRNDTAPRGWDPSAPFVLGNEATGDRPWSGSISEVALTDRALTRTEATAWSAGTPMSEIAPGSVLLGLDFAGSSELPAGWELRPASAVDGDPVVDGRLVVGPGQWLQTSEPVGDISRRIEEAGSFTVAVDAASESPDQSGPARMVSISTDVYDRNLTLAQDGSDLVVRVRSPFTGAGGDIPEYAVPGVFGDDRPRRIVVTYDLAGVSVSVRVADVASTSTIDLQPATVPMVVMFPDEIARIRFSSIGDLARGAFLAAFMFGPWCVGVALVRDRRGSRLVTALLVLAPVVGVETFLALILPLHSFRVVPVVVVGAVALALTAVVAGQDDPDRPAARRPLTDQDR